MLRVTQMKKIILVLIAFLSLNSGLILKAQELKFGVITGLNMSRRHVTNIRDFTDASKIYSPIIMLNANMYIEYKSKSFWGISFEPGYIQKGGLRKDFTVRIGDTLYLPQDVKYISNYIQMPVLLNLYFTKKLFISVGPEFAYLINSTVKSKLYSFDITENFQKIEIAGVIGLNYNLIKCIDIGFLYNHGVTKSSTLIWKDIYGNFIGMSNEYNQYFQFKIRFKL
jgi:hypothetical protein